MGLPGHSYTNNSSEARKRHVKFFQLFKIFVCLICILGFIYQEVEFLSFFYTYPEIVDTTFEVRDEIPLPVFTFCLTPNLSRKKFCEMFPDRCEYIPRNHPDCQMSPYYCSSGETTQVPKLGTYVTNKESDYLRRNISEYVHMHFGFRRAVQFTGPFLYGNIFNKNSLQCYSMSAQMTDAGKRDQKDPMNKRLETHMGVMGLSFIIDLGDILTPLFMPEVYFKVHAPFISANPITSGSVLRRNAIYEFRYNLKDEEHLLPYPYKSDCINYPELWQANEKTGPRSQKECTDQCAMKSDCETYGEVPFVAEYPVSEGCKEDWIKVYNQGAEKSSFALCMSLCKPDCVKRTYDVSVHKTDYSDDPTGRKLFSIEVFLTIENTKVRVRKHRPQYQSVDLFSNTGGYISLWLGVSFFTLVKIIEYPYAIVAFCCRLLKRFKI